MPLCARISLRLGSHVVVGSHDAPAVAPSLFDVRIPSEGPHSAVIIRRTKDAAFAEDAMTELRLGAYVRCRWLHCSHT